MADIIDNPPFGSTRIIYFKEMFASRDGSARGISGVSERRVFRMILDPGDEEFTEQRYPDPRGFVAGEIPFGSPHPWNALSFAADYIVIKRETKTRWLMAVNYKTAHSASDMPFTLGRTPWRLQARGASFSFELLETYPVPQGTNLPGFQSPDSDTKLIATSQFEEVKAPDVRPSGQPDFKTTVWRPNAAGMLGPVTIDLARTEAINPRPQTDDRGGLGATWTRTIADFDFDNMVKVSAAFKAVNSVRFMGAEPGHVRFDAFSLDPIEIVRVGVRSAGQAYRVSLGFTMSIVPYTPIRLHPTFRDKDGNETPVILGAPQPGGEPTLYTEQFNIKRLKSYEPVFDVFGALPV